MRHKSSGCLKVGKFVYMIQQRTSRCSDLPAKQGAVDTPAKHSRVRTVRPSNLATRHRPPAPPAVSHTAHLCRRRVPAAGAPAAPAARRPPLRPAAKRGLRPGQLRPQHLSQAAPIPRGFQTGSVFGKPASCLAGRQCVCPPSRTPRENLCPPRLCATHTPPPPPPPPLASSSSSSCSPSMSRTSGAMKLRASRRWCGQHGAEGT